MYIGRCSPCRSAADKFKGSRRWMPRAGSGFDASSLAAVSPAVSSLTTQPRAYSWHLHGAGQIESSIRNLFVCAEIQSPGLRGLLVLDKI